MAEEFHLTRPFQFQPPSPDHQTSQRDWDGHLRGTDRDGASNHAHQSRGGRGNADIYQRGYARENGAGATTTREQTPNIESEPQSPGKQRRRVHGLSVSLPDRHCIIKIYYNKNRSRFPFTRALLFNFVSWSLLPVGLTAPIHSFTVDPQTTYTSLSWNNSTVLRTSTLS